MEKGAIRLRKIIRQLETRGLPPELLVGCIDENHIRIEKRTKGSGNRTEFTFLIKVERNGGVEIWWPIEYQSPTESINCESVVNEKTMVNLVKQESLLELAETWAKALEAQRVADSVANALL